MRLLERDFSDDERCPSVLIANLHVTSDLTKNLAQMEEVVQVAHEKGANILIFPELCVTGYVWDEDGNEGAWSEPARWTMGLVGLEQWAAPYIGYDAEPGFTVVWEFL